MSNTRKLLLFVFAIAVVINLQLSTPITEVMENGFSLEQLADNIFVAGAFASQIGWCKELNCYSGFNFCAIVVFPTFTVYCYDSGWPWQ